MYDISNGDTNLTFVTSLPLDTMRVLYCHNIKYGGHESLEVDSRGSMYCSEKGGSIKSERPMKSWRMKRTGKQKKEFVLTDQPKETSRAGKNTYSNLSSWVGRM